MRAVAESRQFRPHHASVAPDATNVSTLRPSSDSYRGILGNTPAMHEVFHLLRQGGSSGYPVHISGETGTGKELAARAVHAESRRTRGPFVAINCGAIPDSILDSELFGHVKGAFTGAIRDRKGRFELANRGTLFLDEVGDLSPMFQVKLLRVLEQQKFEPVGGERSINVDVRIISATNRDLRAMTDTGSYRLDLYYRLNVLPIKLPPLRERREDIPNLCAKILEDIFHDTGKQIEHLSGEAMGLALNYGPGNIRELINALQSASVRCSGGQIEAGHLPREIHNAQQQPKNQAPQALDVSSRSPRRLRTKLNRVNVARALVETGGNRAEAARRLGVGRATLYRFFNNDDFKSKSKTDVIRARNTFLHGGDDRYQVQ